MKYKILFIAFVSLLMAGCYSEDALTPTTEPEPAYLLPQGNHDYDTRIVDWNKRCGFYILYRFEPEDVYWDLTVWEGITWSEANQKWDQNTFKALPAEEAYVGRQLDLIEEEFLNFYPDSVLQKWMPLKLLLCSVLWKPSGTDSVDMACRGGFDYLAANYGNSSVENLRQGQIDTLRKEINVVFLKKAIDAGKVTIPEEFGAETVYGKNVAAGAPYSDTCMYAKGFIKAYDWIIPTIRSDWADYVTAIVSNNTEYLESYSFWDQMSGSWWTSNKGMLNEEAKDYNGLVRKKYNIVIRHFKEVYGVDLQRIGNR